jgi:hypothetical protein
MKELALSQVASGVATFDVVDGRGQAFREEDRHAGANRVAEAIQQVQERIFADETQEVDRLNRTPVLL